MDLHGAHVLLTGASGGIGCALAEAFAERGAQLTLTGRNAEVLDELGARVGGRSIVADLSEQCGLDQLLAQVGPLDVLIANAGTPASGQLSDYSVDQIDRALAVNLRAPIVLAKLVGQQMASRRCGHMVFMSSLSGKSASGHMALYNATKFGLRGFSTALRDDLRPYGVGVSTIFPGPIRDAGMIAETDVHIPRLGTRTTEAVAKATIHAVEENIAEVTVAPWSLRAATLLGSLAPELTSRLQRKTGGHTMMAAISRAQQHKR